MWTRNISIVQMVEIKENHMNSLKSLICNQHRNHNIPFKFEPRIWIVWNTHIRNHFNRILQIPSPYSRMWFCPKFYPLQTNKYRCGSGNCNIVTCFYRTYACLLLYTYLMIWDLTLWDMTWTKIVDDNYTSLSGWRVLHSVVHGVTIIKFINILL